MFSLRATVQRLLNCQINLIMGVSSVAWSQISSPNNVLRSRLFPLSKNPRIANTFIISNENRFTVIDWKESPVCFEASNLKVNNALYPHLKAQISKMKVQSLEFKPSIKAKISKLKDRLNPLIRFFTSPLGRCRGFTVVPSAGFISGWPGIH